MYIALPDQLQKALPILRQLREHGFEAVFVGGSVRDTLLGLPIKDVDIATSAKPEQVLELFRTTIPTGLAHGTVTVIHNKIAYEVTTYRQESAYEDYRKPDTVEFITSLEGDLLRRDFTINAMAIDEQGQLIDPYGGHKDLSLGILRCVGDANARFQEDALRMLRAVRFISVYELTPSHRTWRALMRHKALMRFIAMERVQSELDKLLAASSLLRALIYTAKSGLLLHLKKPLMEEIQHKLKQWKQFEPSVERFRQLNDLLSVDHRWSAILIELKLSRNAASHIFQVLRFPKQRMRTILSIIDIHHKMEPMLSRAYEADENKQKLVWYSSILEHGIASAEAWLGILKLSNLSDHINLTDKLERWLSSIEITSLKQLNIRGSELAEHLEEEPGPWISTLLDRLLLEAAIGQLENEKNKLLEQASIWHKKDSNR